MAAFGCHLSVTLPCRVHGRRGGHRTDVSHDTFVKRIVSGRRRKGVGWIPGAKESDNEPAAAVNVNVVVVETQEASNGGKEKDACDDVVVEDEAVAVPKKKAVRRRGRPRKVKEEEEVVLASADEGDAGHAEDSPTELIFKLSRRGYGWGEEIIPHLTVEKRPVKPSASAKRTKTVEMSVAGGDSVLNTYLMNIGVPESQIERLVNSAVAWRMTPGGRPLIDRRRQSRLTRNVKIVAKYLVEKCGVPLGPDGVAAVFMRTPELMLCKPSNNDRWDRRAVELAAFLLKHGHCNVPEVYPENQELGMWVKRQRVTRAAGQLSAERLTILERMGFEFGDLAQVTEEWETRFDMLVDWVLWHGESGETFSWDLIHWGKKGGITARELALWISLQREFYRRQLLPAEAVQRFEAVYSGWRDASESEEEEKWLSWLGRLVYVIEKRRLDMRRPPDGRGNPFSSQRSSNVSDGDARESSRASIARKQVVNTVSSRRQAAASSPFSEDPGLDFWLSRQRWLWRKTKLDPERVKMLQLAGIDMDTYRADDWRRRAHMAAEALQGTHIQLPGLEYGDVSHMRIKVIHWAETQRALFLDGRLSPGQLRYMTFLGLTWVLSEKVVSADDADWLKKWTSLRDHVAESGSEDNCSMELRDWLVQQRGLTYLRLLSEKRRAKLQSLGISLEVQKPLKEELEWNSRLSQVLAHTQEVGHPGVTPENETFSGLHNWIEDCKGMIQQGQLAPGRIAQLKSLSVLDE
ncbi:hypothetical protein M9435_002189 [Picochlorum sp. BPE23]|nr:hypothetical protein M9435_002189 [Picochlorum sp. BPE23]